MCTNRLDETLRDILENLAGSLFPLAEWIKNKDYEPDEASWRENRKQLTMKDLRVIDFFEALLRENAGADVLLSRWDEFESNPLKFNPVHDPQQWRSDRGLGSDPKFGIVEAINLWPSGGHILSRYEHPLSRPEFYAQYWPLLTTVVVARDMSKDGAWQALAKELHEDKCKEWPDRQPLKSSVFMGPIWPRHLICNAGND